MKALRLLKPSIRDKLKPDRPPYTVLRAKALRQFSFRLDEFIFIWIWSREKDEKKILELRMWD